MNIMDAKALPPWHAPANRPPAKAVPAGTVWVRVLESNLHGQGVFAARAIPPSTFIAEYVGELLHACPRDRTSCDH